MGAHGAALPNWLLNRGMRPYTAAMKPLRVNSDDLRIAASGWHTLAGDLTTGAAPDVPAMSSQASAAVVNEIHAAATVTGHAFAARTRITALKTDAAAAFYDSNEANAADKLRAIAESL
jgi:hypothetical protein